MAFFVCVAFIRDAASDGETIRAPAATAVALTIESELWVEFIINEFLEVLIPDFTAEGKGSTSSGREGMEICGDWFCIWTEDSEALAEEETMLLFMFEFAATR